MRTFGLQVHLFLSKKTKEKSFGGKQICINLLKFKISSNWNCLFYIFLSEIYLFLFNVIGFSSLFPPNFGNCYSSNLSNFLYCTQNSPLSENVIWVGWGITCCNNSNFGKTGVFQSSSKRPPEWNIVLSQTKNLLNDKNHQTLTCICTVRTQFPKKIWSHILLY